MLGGARRLVAEARIGVSRRTHHGVESETWGAIGQITVVPRKHEIYELTVGKPTLPAPRELGFCRACSRPNGAQSER